MQYILPLILAITAAGIQFDAPQWDKTLAHVDDPIPFLAYNYVHERLSMSAVLDLKYQ